jgi:hypothetical protein
MIYRHYKGNLYFLEGYATPFSEKFYDKSKTTVEVVAKARYESTLEEVDVVIVRDESVKSTYYAYNSTEIDGVMCFYRDLNGNHWLRPRDNFYEDVNLGDDNTYKSPRFKKISGEHLFDIISELLNED